MEPLGLRKSCEGCGADFTVKYALSCKVSRLVSIRLNEVRDEAGDLATMATQKSAVSYEPPIYFDSGTGVRDSHVSDRDRGNVLVHGLWKRGE